MLAHIKSDLSKAFNQATEGPKDKDAIDVALQSWAYEAIAKIKQTTNFGKHLEDEKSQESDPKTDLLTKTDLLGD